MITVEKERAEELRMLRREARKQLKENQKTNPAFIAMKEAQKQMQRKAYGYAKERTKKVREAAKTAKKESLNKIAKDKQADRDIELMSYVMSADSQSPSGPELPGRMCLPKLRTSKTEVFSNFRTGASSGRLPFPIPYRFGPLQLARVHCPDL